MLMQAFQSAADLGITERQRDALVKTLVLMETGKLTHVPKIPAFTATGIGEYTGHFNMRFWREHNAGCGTVCCIGGTAELIGGVSFGCRPINENNELSELFNPSSGVWVNITVPQAAIALRSYLTIGKARWDLAVEQA
jgi:hypothetical protein